jgi:chemotaxis response regulator CheB
VDKTRVLVANRPRLMRELLMATISDQPDIEIVGEVQDEKQIESGVEQTHPDVLIAAFDDMNEQPFLCKTLLERFPQMRILALAPERNLSVYYWASLDIHADRVETSEQGVLGALRLKQRLAGNRTQ